MSRCGEAVVGVVCEPRAPEASCKSVDVSTVEKFRHCWHRWKYDILGKNMTIFAAPARPVISCRGVSLQGISRILQTHPQHPHQMSREALQPQRQGR